VNKPTFEQRLTYVLAYLQANRGYWENQSDSTILRALNSFLVPTGKAL